MGSTVFFCDLSYYQFVRNSHSFPKSFFYNKELFNWIIIPYLVYIINIYQGYFFVHCYEDPINGLFIQV